ncbi:MAG: hypothetical protein JWO58_2938 [Chitinophagaceae bacterium]|nr:hypothetical protein [Chitinophagaceae bacterium]
MENIDEIKLIIKKLKGEITEKEEQDLTSWLNTSITNQELYQRLSHLWKNAQDPAAYITPDSNLAWKNIQTRIQWSEHELVEQPTPQYSNSFFSSQVYRSLKIAASLVAAILMASLVYMQWMKPAIISTTNNTNTIQEIHLPDQSIIALSPQSSISYLDHFENSERTVTLNGQAFFDVTRDPSHPFSVTTQHLKITVLGTSFYIKDHPAKDSAEVGVFSGKVAVVNNEVQEDNVYLTKDQKAFLLSGKRISIVQEPAKKELVTTAQTLVFKQKMLTEVVANLEKTFNVSIAIESNETKKCRYSGFISKTTIEEALDIITSTMNLSYEKKNSAFIIKGNSCP